MAVAGPIGPSLSSDFMGTFSPYPHMDSSETLSPEVPKAPPSDVEPDKNDYLNAHSYNIAISPNDITAPSPISSDVGTEFDDLDEAVDDDEDMAPPPPTATAPRFFANGVAGRSVPGKSPGGDLKIDPRAYNLRGVEEENAPQSVIHIPSGFGKFVPPHQHSRNQSLSTSAAKSTAPSTVTPAKDKESIDDADKPEASPVDPGLSSAMSVHSESLQSESTAATIKKEEQERVEQEPPRQTTKSAHGMQLPPTPLQTSLPLVKDWTRTPRAQTRNDLSAFSRPGSSLASISEAGDDDDDEEEEDDEPVPAKELDRKADTFFRDTEAEIAALKSALAECWTLCNTLAGLSHIHRERMFEFAGKGDMQEHAWKSCWKLCQNLYDTRDDNTNAHIRPTLDLCRLFCSALFEVRVRTNETADSVLRVSFELNNHLFNTHDRGLPEAFRERTLDFYITLCHRLMKQRSKLAEETDSLLRACWSLAEMLFSLRQNKREGKKADEELLGSAIQSCWELCDLFREGWTQIRPERGTPRPSQTTFSQAFDQARRSGFAPLDENGNPRPSPETPTTLFEDNVTISPDDPPNPHIFILEEQKQMAAPKSATSTTSSQSLHSAANTGAQRVSRASAIPKHRWPTSATSQSLMSAASDLSMPFSMASSVRTQGPPPEDLRLIILKSLFVRAAIQTNRGYSRTSADPNLNSLPNFVKTLPESAFGSQVWQVSLLENFRRAVLDDISFRPEKIGTAATYAERPRPNASELARAVLGMCDCVYGFGWLKDLFRYVFGFYIEEALKTNGKKKEMSKPRSKS